MFTANNMALLDINCFAGAPVILEFNRGNIGTITDISTPKLNSFEVPTGTPAGAVYPVADDVDQGVVYGPNGNDYTGNLKQPAESDVKSGIKYGANGTEKTGTLVGGGGNIFVISD